MSNLDSYHPFRASVQPGAVQNNSASGSNSGDEFIAKKSANDEEDEYKPWFSWKTKLKMFIGASAFGILYYIGSVTYAAFAGDAVQEANVGSSLLQEMQGREEGVSDQQIFFDRSDLNERGRSVQEARQKAGFFKNFFCKGGKRSSFFCE